ncbi:hypothetical protein EGI22_21585 [Lacihabitans sp. LS3-19]|nr:hypothetical protein [Lacihabitans sp. LS3-19]
MIHLIASHSKQMLEEQFNSQQILRVDLPLLVNLFLFNFRQYLFQKKEQPLKPFSSKSKKNQTSTSPKQA